MDLSVVTATRQRPAFLLHCLHQFAAQSLGGLKCESIVVSDGPDSQATELARHNGSRYFETPRSDAQWGTAAKDRGIAEARGRYVCFWDDDNIYEPHALTTLLAAAEGYDSGVVRVRHRYRRRPGLVTLPRRWTGEFLPGDIDTMCVCVRTQLARRECWNDGCAAPGTDIRWLKRLEAHQPTVRYVPIIIGMHV